MTKGTIVKAAIRRFYHLPTRTIARHLLETYGQLWDNDLERIRRNIRYYLGKSGSTDRAMVKDKDLFRNEKVDLPPTWRKITTPYHLPPRHMADFIRHTYSISRAHAT